MRFELSTDQADLAEVAREFFTDAAEADRAEVLAGRRGQDPKVWRQLTQELGLAGIAIAEDDGGAGGTWLDLSLVLEASGTVVSSQPFLPAAGASVALLRSVAEDGGQVAAVSARPLLEEIASGTRSATWVDANQPATTMTAAQAGDGWTVEGEHPHVLSGDTAELLLVTARTPDGPGLFVVEHEQASELLAETPLDPTRPLATVRFAGAAARPVHLGVNESTLRRAQAITRILLSCEQVGVGQGALDLAVEYAMTRHQFGRPIGGFQSIKHLLADAYGEVDTARAAARFAAWTLSNPEGADLVELAALTAAHVSPAVERTAATALQIFGGVGYTWEHAGHLYYKRAVSSARLLSTADDHLDLLANGLGLGTTTD